jgi:hypothetical protein
MKKELNLEVDNQSEEKLAYFSQAEEKEIDKNVKLFYILKSERDSEKKYFFNLWKSRHMLTENSSRTTNILIFRRSFRRVLRDTNCRSWRRKKTS